MDYDVSYIPPSLPGILHIVTSVFLEFKHYSTEKIVWKKAFDSEKVDKK